MWLLSDRNKIACLFRSYKMILFEMNYLFKERIFKGKKEEQRPCIIAVEEEKLSILDSATRVEMTLIFISIKSFYLDMNI